MKTLFYATIDPHLDIPVVWEFSVKPRKDGSYKAEVMLPFMGYITILQKYNIADCSDTAREAMEKLKARKLRSIEHLDSKRDQLAAEVNQINSTEARLIKFPIEIKPKPRITI